VTASVCRPKEGGRSRLGPPLNPPLVVILFPLVELVWFSVNITVVNWVLFYGYFAILVSVTVN